MKVNPFAIFVWRVTAVHMITYFIVGLLAMFVFNYREAFATESLQGFMKPLDSPWVALGPGLQVIRGLLFGLALWPFITIILAPGKGWWKLWFLFVTLGILATFGPAMGSVDGMIYTTVPVGEQLLYLPELFGQSLLLSLGIYYWYKRPFAGYNYVALTLVALILLMSIAGYQAAGMGMGL
jgi:hypothetical protein